ncbi:MFS transporter [soil metagenome]
MANYAKVLKVPGFAVLIASTTLTRLPFAINGLAVLLFLRETTGSFGTAGLAAGALALGAGIGAPAASRLVDRRGAIALLPLACGHAIALLSLWGLGSIPASTPALVALAAFAGLCFPPSGSVLRSRWPEMLGGDPALIRGAYALDSVTIEVSFVTGPLITAVLVVLIGPQAALALSAALVIAGTLLFLSKLPDPRRSVPHEHRVGGLGPMRAPAMRMIALSTIPMGFVIGTIEVTLPAFSRAEASPAAAGILLALWSLSSGVGGLLFGARTSRRELFDTYLAITVLLPLASLPLIIAGSPLAMGALVILAGAPIAPLIATRNELVALVAPASGSTEAFSWLMTSLIVGLSLGTAVAGGIVEAAAWPEAVLVGVAVGLAGAALTLVRRDSLRPAPAPT